MGEPTASSTLGAREIARYVAAGELSAREAVEEHVRRIEEANPRLNAVVPLFDRARRGGRRLRPFPRCTLGSSARRVGRHQGAVPCGRHADDGRTAKPRLAQGRGGRTTCGAAAASGAIVLGKTNVSQLLIYHESDIPVERFLGELDAGRFDAIGCPPHAPPALKHGAPASSC